MRGVATLHTEETVHISVLVAGEPHIVPVALVLSRYESLIQRCNRPVEGNGVYCRYENPVITAEMVPPTWRYDFNPATNPCFMERIGVNATLNSGAIKWNGKYEEVHKLFHLRHSGCKKYFRIIIKFHK